MKVSRESQDRGLPGRKMLTCCTIIVPCLWLSAVRLAHAEVADIIRDSMPPVDTPLLKSLVGCRMSGVSPTWADFSIDLDAALAIPERAWVMLRDPGLGAPLKIDEGLYALLTSDGQAGVNLWHLDVKRHQIMHRVHVDAGVDGADGADGFHEWHWHRIGDRFVCELLSISISERQKFVGEKKLLKVDGNSLTTTIDLRTGDVRRQAEAARFLNSRQQCLEKLSKHLLDAGTRRNQPNVEAAKVGIVMELAQAGVEFDFDRGRFHLSRETFDSLCTKTADLCLNPKNVAEIKRMRDEIVDRLPTCPAVRDLLWQLQLGEAVASEDVDMIDKLWTGWTPVELTPERAAALRNLAGYQRLHFIATGVNGCEGDRREDYHAFVTKAPKSLAARDAAILRIHEIAFRKACEISTVDAFDEFVTSFPSSMQVQDARQHAYALEEERISNEASRGADMERVANALYVRWRDDDRNDKVMLAERSFRLLSEHPDLMKTARAVDAQDTRDNLNFRDEVIGLQRQQNQTLSEVAKIQQNQLEVMGQQLSAQQAVASQLGGIGGQLQYMNENVRVIGNEQTRTRQAIENMVEQRGSR